MNKLSTGLIILCLSVISLAKAQVDEIKNSSSSHKSDSRSSNNSGGAAVNIFFQLMFNNIVQWQQAKLQQRSQVPSIVSLETMFQGAVQPSSYYIFNPRIRGNWGLFSTDFRFNYLVEEGIHEVKLLRTNDWQILQLNLVTSKDVTFRMGGGIMKEAFGVGNIYSEWTAALNIRPMNSRIGGFAEYRNSQARREVNAHLRYSFFEKGRLHGYLTAGGVFQRYYSSVNVWGLQGGVAFSLY
jgi:hypothetical protein